MRTSRTAGWVVFSVLVPAVVTGCVSATADRWAEAPAPITPIGRPWVAAPDPSRAPAVPMTFRPDVLNVGTTGFRYATPTGPVAARTLTIEPGPPLPVRPGEKHLVAPGETLMAIARDRLGDAARWRDIVAANPGLNPAQIMAGQELKLPY